MVFSDGECPSCVETMLHLNTLDLLECPKCNLVCANIDGLIATIMPFRGDSEFRFEDCQISQLNGTAFAKSSNGSVIPNENEIFTSRQEIAEYIAKLPKNTPPIVEGIELSKKFNNAFSSFVSECPKEIIKSAWDSKTKRTIFYSNYAMPAIAIKLNLIHGKEEFKVDYVMSKISRYDYAVPKIYIESENDFESAEHEIKKLCSLNSPLRVLITITNKDLSSNKPSSGYDVLRDWQAIIRSHYDINSNFQGVINVIIGRAINDLIDFVAFTFKSSGDLLLPISPLVSRCIG